MLDICLFALKCVRSCLRNIYNPEQIINMKIEIHIENKHVLIMLASIAIISGIGLVIAYGGSQPSLMGHTWGEVECNDCITAQNIGPSAVGSDEIATDAVGADELVASGVLEDLKTVDGNNSGLDADTVDGLNASSIEVWRCECWCWAGSYGFFLTDKNRNGQRCEVHADVCEAYFRNCQFKGYLLAPSS
jgi:hypothetical protein